MSIETAFFNTIEQFAPASRFCIALSGGLDSRVLLHLFSLLAQKNSRIEVRAIHVHHGLSPNADAWLDTCRQFCLHAQIPLTVKHITVIKKPQESLEAQARQSRYHVLQESLKEKELLVTAHHQDDQAETLLLQLFRGAGPKGLSAMPLLSSSGQYPLLRPLLNTKRFELEQYAVLNNLEWVVDESNDNTVFDRNFIRHELLPLIKTRWPDVIASLARSAKHCADADQLLKYHYDQIFASLFESDTQALSLTGLLALDELSQNYMLRHWIQYLGFALPSTQKLQILRHELVDSRQDAKPLITWSGVEVRRYRNRLYAMSPISSHDPSLVLPWDMSQNLELPNDLGEVSLIRLREQGLDAHKLVTPITVRFRQGGERCRLKNRQHHHSLKKLFQDWGVLPWLRDRVPLLYAGDTLKAVIGYTVCDD